MWERSLDHHSILKRVPTMAPDANSFFRIGRDGLMAELRRSGRLGTKLVAELEESVCYRPGRAVASGMEPQLYVGRYLGHHTRLSSILIMSTDGVVMKFRRMIEESRWKVHNWNALHGLRGDVTDTGGRKAAEVI